jgi:coatomer subunit gamma
VATEEEPAAEDDKPMDNDPAAYIYLEPLPMTFDKLERSMKLYMSSGMKDSTPITITALPVVEDVAVVKAAVSVDVDGADDEPTANGVTEAPREVVDPAAAVYAIPELAQLGRAFRSAAPVPLTESETEYVVQCTKHIFANNVVLQFSVQNTIEDQRLDNVTVMVDDSDAEGWTVSGEVPANGIKYGDTKNCFTILEREGDGVHGSFTCELRFTVVKVDSATGEEEGDTFEEEYPIEDLEITTADFMAKVAVPDFRKAWDAAGNENEVLEKFALQFKKAEDAVSAVIDYLGMQACDGTAQIKTPGKPHMMHLSGVFFTGQQVLARAQVADGGSVLKIAVRSEDDTVSRLVADCIR